MSTLTKANSDMSTQKIEINFEDLLNIFYNDAKVNKMKKDYDGMEPFFESTAEEIDREQTLDALNEIYDLVKHNSDGNEKLEETKQEFIKKYGSRDASPDDEEELENTITLRKQVSAKTNTKLERAANLANNIDKLDENFRMDSM